MFLDSQRNCWIDIAWRWFQSQVRNSLDQPVEYEAVYYLPDAQLYATPADGVLRALQALERTKADLTGLANVIKFPLAAA